ncbi:hypothetical protein ACLQ3C_11630 [Gordonia sp. DT30]|uniref:hypothetical protein n=1 Tax=unclassified Gordonia (in: high G+C Gram-positive bacteria) TaxID=2657482 RepID=UPI003CF181B2
MQELEPIPEGWNALRGQSRAIAALVAVFGTIALYWTYHGIRAVTEGRFLYCTFYLCAAAAFASVSALSLLVVLQRHRTDIRAGSLTQGPTGALTIGTSTSFRSGYMAIVVFGASSCGVFAYGVPSHALSFPMTKGQGLVFPFVVGAIGLFLLVLGALFANRRLQFPRIICTPKQIGVVSFKNSAIASWDDIASIEAVAGQKNADLSITSTGAAEPLRVNADLLAVGAVPLYSILRHYLRHPEERGELGDGRARDRFTGASAIAE